jgi:hypothetical protein
MNLRRRLHRQANGRDGTVFDVFGIEDQQVRAQALVQAAWSSALRSPK